MKTVICSHCQKAYQSIHDSDHQGVYCSSDYFEKHGKRWIICSYGSEFDTDLYEVLYPTTIFKKEDNICDSCIRRYIKDGVLKLVSTENQMEIDYGEEIETLHSS